MAKRHISLVFGAGSSTPAELPSTRELTSRIMAGQGIWIHSDSNYYIGESFPELGDLSNVSDPNVQAVLWFISLLDGWIQKHDQRHSLTREVTYEDIYYLASQVFENEVGELDNPALQPFIDALSAKITYAPKIESKHPRFEVSILDLSSQAQHYITCLVWQLLMRQPSSLEHLSFLAECCKSPDIEDIDIITVNHDTLIERCLSKNGIQYDDGFSDAVNQVRYWNPLFFERKASDVRIIKLHGSVNWFRFPPNMISPGVEAIGITEDWDFWHTRNPQGDRQWPHGTTPELLVGTFNKVISYSYGIYADLYHHFRVALRRGPNLVVCGYGFGDKAINTQILEWAYLSEDHRLVVIHPRPNNLRLRSRPAIGRHWDTWISMGKLRIIPKGVENTSWSDVWDEFEDLQG